jgi:probable HAF family extracellular repeat protein
VKKNLSLCIKLSGLIAAFAIPLQMSAQQPRYKLIDIGTFGGPQSYLNPGSGNDFGDFTRELNSKGVAVGFADTDMQDPFPNICFSDCFVAHAFRAGGAGHLHDLEALPGGGSSLPTWINDNGLIVGFSENGETDLLYAGLPQLRAVLWQHGRIKDLGTLGGGYQSEANAVNNAGEVVGASTNTIPDSNSMQSGNFNLWGPLDPPYANQMRAFLWDRENGMQDLGTLPGGTNARALLINERGQVVGHSYTGSNPSPFCNYPLSTDSFIWQKDTGMVDLGGLGGTCTLAFNLNERGQVVGSSNLAGDQQVHGFLWEHGNLRDLGGSLGGNFTGAGSINEAGEAVGFGYLAGDTTFHATLWRNVGKLNDLGVLGTDQCSYATGINTREQVVGGSVSDCTTAEPNFRAFLWEHGTMFDLNALVPSGSPLYLQFVETINDRGEIAGTGVDASGNEHAFLLIPCDKDHADVEGCDHNVVNASPAASATPIQSGGATADANQSRRPMSLPRTRHDFGIPMPWIRGVTKVGVASVTPGDATSNDLLHESSVSPATNLGGNCLVNPSTDELTGRCIHSFVWFCMSGKSSACPAGAKATKPVKGMCGLLGGPTIDAGRGCFFTP